VRKPTRFRVNDAIIAREQISKRSASITVVGRALMGAGKAQQNEP
jgi:hypothetical protein